MGIDASVPLTAFFVVTVLGFVLRWIFKPSRQRTGRPDTSPTADLGMLTPVVYHAPRADAIAAKNTLSLGGIRCSLSRIDTRTYDVLVFRPDAERAAALVSTPPTRPA